MNYLDLVILAPLVWGVYRGFSKGLIVEVASLLALVVGIWCAIHFNAMTASVLVNDLGLNVAESYLAPIAFAVTFIAVALVIVLVSRIIDKLLSAIALGGINKVFGAVFGGIKALLIVAVLVYFVNQLDAKFQLIDAEKKEESLFYEKLTTWVEDWLPRIDFEDIKKELPDVKPMAGKTKKV